MASQPAMAVNEPYPSPSSAEAAVEQRGFRISTRKLPISRAEPIERMTEALGITPPEMIFGDNHVQVEHMASGFCINFNTFDALDAVDKTAASMLQVAHSREWQRSR